MNLRFSVEQSIEMVHIIPNTYAESQVNNYVMHNEVIN